jgi:hypothetical protein
VCLQHLATSKPQGDGRKRTLFMQGIYFKKTDPDGWKNRLEESNQNFAPPLPSDEVTGVIKSLGKKDYQYTCNEEPMKSHCDSYMCRVRKFGVGGASEYPKIVSMQVLMTEPPMWFVDIEGATIVLNTDELQNYQKFHKACMGRIKRVFKMIRQDVWYEILQEAMDKVTELELPEGSGYLGKFKELLGEFLTNRARGKRKEDLLNDRPWFDDEQNRYYFTLKGFESFLTREGYKDKERADVVSKIHQVGYGKRQFNFENKHSKTVMWVDGNKIDAAPKLSLPAPAKQEEGEI